MSPTGALVGGDVGGGELGDRPPQSLRHGADAAHGFVQHGDFVSDFYGHVLFPFGDIVLVTVKLPRDVGNSIGIRQSIATRPLQPVQSIAC
jgi:hypothetical protein